MCVAFLCMSSFLPHNFYLHWQNNGACSLLKLSLVQMQSIVMVVVGGWAAAKLDETNSCTYIWINFCIFELPLRSPS